MSRFQLADLLPQLVHLNAHGAQSFVKIFRSSFGVAGLREGGYRQDENACDKNESYQDSNGFHIVYDVMWN